MPAPMSFMNFMGQFFNDYPDASTEDARSAHTLYMNDPDAYTSETWQNRLDEGQDAIDAHEDILNTQTPDGPGFGGDTSISFGDSGITYADLEGKTEYQIFQILQNAGIIPDDAFPLDYLEDIRNMPIPGGVSQEDRDAAAAGVAEDVYGFETDIERAEDDYALAEARGKEDIGVAGEGARSDIYGLQGAGAQQKRAGMFGKGLGGGMSQLAQQDASQAMRGAGQGIMSGLASNVRGLNRGITDAGTTRDRTVEDATTGLYGVGGTGEDNLGIGGVYGTGGSEATGIYNLEDAADNEWESDFSTHWNSVTQD